MSEKNKIFIVEDTGLLVTLLCQILEEEDYEIQVAMDGEEALTKIESFMPDIILLDIMLPKIDGFTVCKKIKSSPKTKEIPVIFLTGKAALEDIVKGFELGAVDYITKPFEETVLLARVHTHLELKKQRDKLAEVNKQLEELNATKDKFFSIIAHDLRSPFTALMGFSQQLAENLEDFSPSDIKLSSFHIYDASKKAHILLENLLKWAQTQIGTITVEKENFDLWALSNEVVELLLENAYEKEVTLTDEVQRESFIFADKNMMETVLRNLISNALKFTPKGGEVKVSFKETDEYKEFVVSDTGVGIKKIDMDNLFQLDKCISHIGTNGEKGTGLGLILCKEFVEKNDGTILIESEQDKGTTFSIRFAK